MRHRQATTDVHRASIVSGGAVKVGDLEICVVSAGPLDIGEPQKAFDAASSDDVKPRELWSASSIVVEQNVLAIRSQGRVAIFETGAPTRDSSLSPLCSELTSADIEPESVDAIIPTHAHLDHVGGIMRPDGRRYFPNARIHLHPSDAEFWLADERLGTRAERSALVARRNLIPNLDRLVRHVDGQETFPGVTAMHTPGHTVGHTSFIVGSGSDLLFVVGDVVHHPCQLAHPRIRMLFDTDPDAGAETRLKVLEFLASRTMPAFFYHFPFPGCGFVERAGEGYRFLPLPM